MTIESLYECNECQRAAGSEQEIWVPPSCHPRSNWNMVSLEAASDTFEEPEHVVMDITEWGDPVTTYGTGARRADGNKLRYDLLPTVALRDTTQVFTFGSAKYGDRNWEKGFDWSIPYASMMRHLTAWWHGEDFDKESGVSHLAHAACNLMFLQHFEYFHKAGDNRPAAGCSLPPLRTKNEEQRIPTIGNTTSIRPPPETCPRW